MIFFFLISKKPLQFKRRGGRPIRPQNGMRLERTFSKPHTKHGTLLSPQKLHLIQLRASRPVVVSATGRHGAPIGGIGATKTNRSTRGILQMESSSFISTTKGNQLQRWRNASLSTHPVELNQPAKCEQLPSMDAEKKSLKLSWMLATKAHCSSVVQ